MATTPHQPFGLQHTPTTPKQAHLTQPLEGGHGVPEPRHNQHHTHKNNQSSRDARTNAPLLMRLERRREASEWQGLAEPRKSTESADDGVHCAPEPHTGEATISNCHKALRTNTAPSRRERRRSAAASRSDKSDLGFPLAWRGGAARPKNTPPRRTWHPQVSP
jgi:hypothetical protein